MFNEMAGDRDPESPMKSAMAKLADTFRPLSSYAKLDGTALAGDKEDVVHPYECPQCGVWLIDGTKITGEPVTAEYLPVADGDLIPTASATTPVRELHFVDYNPRLEQTDMPRLRVHACGSQP